MSNSTDHPANGNGSPLSTATVRAMIDQTLAGQSERDAATTATHKPATGSITAPLEIDARTPRTLGSALTRLHHYDGKRAAAEQVWVNRMLKGHETPAWVNVPAGIVLSGATIILAVVLPPLGVDFFGVTAALMPSAEELGGPWGARLIAGSIGGLMGTGAFGVGMVAASVIFMTRKSGRAVGILAAGTVALAFLYGVHEVGKDRGNGLRAAQIEQQAETLDIDIDEIDRKMAKLQADALRGRARTSAPISGLPALEERRRALLDQQAALEKRVVETKTTGSLSYLQGAGFLAAALIGAYFELGAMLRLEGRIKRLRAKTLNAWGQLVWKARALVGIELKKECKGDNAPQVVPEEGARSVAEAVLLDVAVKPVFEPLEKLLADARSERSKEKNLDTPEMS